MKKIPLEKIKLIRSLKERKERTLKGLFWAEGKRNIDSLLKAGLLPELLVAYDNTFFKTLPVKLPENKLYTISEKNALRIKSTKKFPGMGAVFPIKKSKKPSGETVLALDKINDPGNLGTIIRTALWFGIKDIITDTFTCDPYNEKVIRATMGALGRINIIMCPDLPTYLKENCHAYSIYAADMRGKKADQKIPGKKIIIMGNEAHGVSDELKNLCKNLIHIPGSGMQESLNVAVATGIILFAQS